MRNPVASDSVLPILVVVIVMHRCKPISRAVLRKLLIFLVLGCILAPRGGWIVSGLFRNVCGLYPLTVWRT